MSPATIPTESNRREARYACIGLVDVFEVTPQGRLLFRGPAMLQDISASGARMQTDFPFQVGSELMLKSKAVEVEAKVRHVSQQYVTYLSGVSFQREFRWNPNVPSLPVTLTPPVGTRKAPSGSDTSPQASASKPSGFMQGWLRKLGRS